MSRISVTEKPKVIYALSEGIGGAAPGGGARVIFEHLNGLHRRGYKVALFHLGSIQKPEWFDLEFPIIKFVELDDLIEALKFENAKKVATWWQTSYPVNLGSKKGEGFYLVQDIETSYVGSYQEAKLIFKSYELGLKMFTDSTWAQDQLKKIYGMDVPFISPAINHSVFFRWDDAVRGNKVLYLDRTHYLKGRDIFEEAIRSMAAGPASVELTTFGHESPGTYRGVRHKHADFPKTDDELALLYNRARCFVLSSLHEGFGIPILEAMACGCAVVTTRADGNESYCRDEDNCLLVDKEDAIGMAQAITRVLEDDDLCQTLVKNGLKTAKKYEWKDRLDKLELVLGLKG